MIRKYNNGDLRTIKLLVKKWYWPFFTNDHYAKFTAVENDQIVGVAVISITINTANIDFIYVKKDFRSSGIGKKLLERCQAYARSKKAEGVGVNCGQENKNAKKFYKKEGFQKVGQVYNYFSNNNLQIFFWKRL